MWSTDCSVILLKTRAEEFWCNSTEIAKASASEAMGRILTEEITALNSISNNNY